jgi:hypothetical protein
MKKLVLVLALVLIFALPVLANPFADVPLNHWAYDSVEYLWAKGAIIGYPDGTFGGNRTMTRYEFAEAVAKALAWVESQIKTGGGASADDVAVLEKLSIEFADELASLGVKVADLEAALGANSAALTALEATVAKHERFFDQVVITGDLTATYRKVVTPMTVATLKDESDITFTATINDETTAGVTLKATDVLSGVATAVTWSNFFVNTKDLNFQIGRSILPDSIGLGLISSYTVNYDEFNGFLVTWDGSKNDTNLGTWTLIGNVEDYYVLHVALPVGDKDQLALGVTASYDQLAGGYVGGVDLVYNLNDNNKTSIAIEGGVFYGTALSALSYAAAVKVGTSLSDDLALAVTASYVLPGFVPTKSGFSDDTIKVGGSLVYTVDAALAETAEVDVTYNISTAGITAKGIYMNLPLADKFVLSGAAQYETIGAAYAAVATLEYALSENTNLNVEGRIDSNGAAFWSAEAQLVYTVATNTTLKLGYEQNDWEMDINDVNDYSNMNILDTLGTVKAGIEVTF